LSEILTPEDGRNILSRNVGDKPNYAPKTQKIGKLFNYFFLTLVFTPALLNYKYTLNEDNENIAARHSYN